MKKRNIQFLMIFLLSVITGNVMAQQEVTGVVSDDIGELLPGATVMVKGTDDGTVTDFDGNYSITVPDNASVLVISFIGMKTVEVEVADQTTLDVVMTADSQVMDEVIVTALGISREAKALGYSVSQVDGDALVEVPQENVINGLAGKVSGVAINSIGGPGSSVSMVIRGATSLSSDNQPLYVVDGTPVYNTLNNVGGVGDDNRVDYGSAISDLNPDDIESMTVLKGASAAALYGSRAGNGVVLITTKSGKATKGMGVTINSSTVFDVPYKYLDVHDQYAISTRPYTNDIFPSNEYNHLRINEGSSSWAGPALDQGITAIHWPYTPEEIASGIPVPRELTSAGKNNAENFFQTAITSTNNISIQDNTEKLDYRMSYTNMRNQGYIPNTDISRNSISLNSKYKLVTDDPSRKWLNGLSVSSSLNYTKSQSDNRPANNRGANPIQALYEIGPHIDIRDMKDYWLPGYEGLVQNSPYTFGTDPTETEWNNPYYLAHEVNNGFERNRIYGNVRADWQITDAWSFFARYNFDEVNEVRETKMSSGYTREPNGAYGLTNINRNETNADFLLTWKKDYENWNFSASVGGNMRKNRGSTVVNQTKNSGQGLVIPNLLLECIPKLSAFTGVQTLCFGHCLVR
jgi:TonB-linked SusC/RagA family outer membrane protein